MTQPHETAAQQRPKRLKGALTLLAGVALLGASMGVPIAEARHGAARINPVKHLILVGSLLFLGGMIWTLLGDGAISFVGIGHLDLRKIKLMQWLMFALCVALVCLIQAMFYSYLKSLGYSELRGPNVPPNTYVKEHR